MVKHPRDFADRIKELREERKVSQNELASAAKLSPAHFSRVLSGDRPLRMEQAVLLAQALGITVIELTSGTTVENIVAEWVPRHEYEESDRLRAEAERELELLRNELGAGKAENASLKESVRTVTTRIVELEGQVTQLQGEASRANQLATLNGDLNRRNVQLAGEKARLESQVAQLQEQAQTAADLANRNYGAWAAARNQVQSLEKSLAKEKSESVGVAFVSAALGAVAAAMVASPAQTRRRRTS